MVLRAGKLIPSCNLEVSESMEIRQERNRGEKAEDSKRKKETEEKLRIPQ